MPNFGVSITPKFRVNSTKISFPLQGHGVKPKKDILLSLQRYFVSDLKEITTLGSTLSLPFF